MRRTRTRYSKVGLRIARDYERCLSAMCCHVSNDDYYGKPFLLEPFQRDNIWKPLLACGKVERGSFRRRFRRAVLGLPSGYGKTELAAGITMTLAIMEPIHNGQYGVVASSLDQVANIQDKIKTMIRLNPDLSGQWDLGSKVITNVETNAKIMVFPNKADALESWHCNVLVFDELHTYRDDKVWMAGIKGQKVIPNALTIGITTAGDSREGFLWDLLERADSDPGLYLYWLGLNDSDDIGSRRAWEKMMVAPWVTWESIQDQRASSTKRAFERYTANRFPLDKGSRSCFTARQLSACCKAGNAFDPSRPFALGIDGATSGDSFAMVAYQEARSEDARRTERLTREWVWDEPDEETGRYPLNDIMELIADLHQRARVEVIGVDPNRMSVMCSQLEDVYGVETVAFAQNNATMCQASSMVAHAIKSRELQLAGCPKLKEHLGNVVEDDKGAYGMRFGKDAKRSKIDAAIALAIAQLAYEKLVAGKEELVPVF